MFKSSRMMGMQNVRHLERVRNNYNSAMGKVKQMISLRIFEYDADFDLRTAFPLVQPEGLGKLKKNRSSGTEPATLRFVA
jgi:hypothetical protein